MIWSMQAMPITSDHLQGSKWNNDGSGASSLPSSGLDSRATLSWAAHLRRFFRFVGPTWLIAVTFVDPGGIVGMHTLSRKHLQVRKYGRRSWGAFQFYLIATLNSFRTNASIPDLPLSKLQNWRSLKRRRNKQTLYLSVCVFQIQ